MGKFFLVFTVGIWVFLGALWIGSANISSDMRAENLKSLKETGELLYDGESTGDDLRAYIDSRD